MSLDLERAKLARRNVDAITVILSASEATNVLRILDRAIQRTEAARS